MQLTELSTFPVDYFSMRRLFTSASTWCNTFDLLLALVLCRPRRLAARALGASGHRGVPCVGAYLGYTLLCESTSALREWPHNT